MGIGPIPAVQKLLAKTGLTLKDIDLVELNNHFIKNLLRRMFPKYVRVQLYSWKERKF